MPRVTSPGLLVPTQPNLNPEYCVIYFEVSALKFDGPQIAPDCVLWPGGEWHGRRPIWRVAADGSSDTRKNPQRAEIWVLRLDEQLLLDPAGRVRLLRFRFGAVELARVGLSFVVEYLAVSAQLVSQVKGIDWIYRTLEKIASSNPQMNLSKEMSFVRRRLSDVGRAERRR